MKARLKISLRLFRMLCAIGLISPIVTGCLGPKVLSERTEHVPAPDPHVEMYLRTGKPADVLVIYNDQNPKTHKVTRRAFYLFSNFNKVTQGEHPEFVQLSSFKNMRPVPVFQGSPTNANVAARDLYAVFSTPHDFKLFSQKRQIADCCLPQFGDWFTVKKLLLFPGAVAADAVFIGPAIEKPEETAEVATALGVVAAEAAIQGGVQAAVQATKGH